MKNTILILATFITLMGCTSTFKTDYAAGVDLTVSKNWKLNSVSVNVPDELTVSEQENFTPDGDIVWREDPDPRNRREQVANITKAGIERGASGLRGSRPVNLSVTLLRFHALSERARTRLSSSGVHNIDFAIKVFDARTGEALTDTTHIQADLIAYSGQDSLNARANGQTQKVRITNHIAKTIAGWLGIGPDNRGEFSRRGI